MDSPRTPRPLPIPTPPTTPGSPRPLPSPPAELDTQSPSRLVRLSRRLSQLITPTSARSSVSYSAVSGDGEEDRYKEAYDPFGGGYFPGMSSTAVHAGPPSPSLNAGYHDEHRVAKRRSWGAGAHQPPVGWDPLQVDDDPFSANYQIGSGSKHSLDRINSDSDLRDDEEVGTPRERRKTVRYSVSPSPMRKTGTVIQTVGKNLRRASLRVVGLRDTDAAYGQLDNEEEEYVEAPQPGLLRGRTLGCMGPRSSVRLFLFRVMSSPYTEMVILLGIIVNAVVLTVQASRTLVLPSADSDSADPPSPAHIRGYFHTWEDYALFALFAAFSFEAVARIAVSGLVLDPEIPISALFASPLRSRSALPIHPDVDTEMTQTQQRKSNLRRSVTSIHASRQSIIPDIEPPRLHAREATDGTEIGIYGGQSRDGDYLHVREGTGSSSNLSPAKGPLSRGLSLGARMETLGRNLREPFTLRAGSESSATLPEKSAAALTNINEDKPAFIGGKDPKAPLQLPFALSVMQATEKTARGVPYLRQSWGRVDFIAIMGFWGSFVLSTLGLERGSKHIALFRAMSVLRTGRLLGITSGTTTIMHSLKTARPLLASVAYFVLFAMVLFSIIGIQTFSGSLRRSCYLQPSATTPGITDEIKIELDGTPQTCGGYINASLQTTGYIDGEGRITLGSKGYICPLGQVCREAKNPLDNIESFDTIYSAALQVVIIASANGWTPLMYTMIDAEYFFSCFFFIICVVVLNFWLINLFVAVITNTFSLIRSETNKSAFGAEELKAIDVDDEDSDNEEHDAGKKGKRKRGSRTNWAKLFYTYTEWAWVLLALASLVLQASRTVQVGDMHEAILYYGELIITLFFDAEILIRMLASLPDYRSWFTKGRNLLDLGLCIATSIIQIPVIRNNGELYAWFTFFQLARFYRVILVVPRMRPLLLAVFGNMYGLVNMSLFLLLVNYLAALVGVQLLRGDITEDNTVNFGELYNAFLGVYQVFSSENWTDILYGAASAEIKLGQTVIVAIYVTAWMLFANFIVLQMFIAVINENFDVAEESKRSKQAQTFWAQQQAMLASRAEQNQWLRRLNPYRWVRANPVTVKVENLPSNLVLPMQKSLVQDQSHTGFGGRSTSPIPLSPNSRTGSNFVTSPTSPSTFTGSGLGIRGFSGSMTRKLNEGKHHKRQQSRSLTLLQKLFTSPQNKSDDVPLATLNHVRAASGGAQGSLDMNEPIEEETARQLELLATINQDTGVVPEDITDAIIERRAQKADFIRDHPTYDKTFWIFSQKNPIRRLCQKFVHPAGGERIFGTAPHPTLSTVFSLFLLMVVIAGVVVESFANPTYRRNFYRQHGFVRGTWFDIAEMSLSLVLLVEFFVKIMADGFIFTPNAYVRSIWNVIDFVILVGLSVNVITGLIFIGGLSRITRSLKALRAIRGITLMESMRNTFRDLILSGAMRILDAAVLAILYMIPYAVWGLNIFAGKMNECNDSSDGIGSIGDCVNEYTQTVYGENFGFLVPRVWDNPQPSTKFSFDSFRASLLILFEIVSLEGWIDVMGVATSITGRNQQPQTNASQVNSIFFLIYNLLGGVVILTLFVSIIIGNFSSKTGTAFLTKSQREWIDLQKLFTRQRPSKRPQTVPTFPFRRWCFDRATQKRGYWYRGLTIIFVLEIIALMTQTFTPQKIADSIRNNVFLAITFIYTIDVVVRFIGLGLRSFKADGWNLFDVFVAGGSFVTTLTVRLGANGYVLQQLQKLFLVGIAFKLVQRTNSLNKLFKTAVASLTSLVSLLVLWFILFVFFGIMFLEVFGLTKWDSGESANRNYSTLGHALVMLAFMSTGEGWNQYMHDYTLVYPRCTNSSPFDPSSDCGSVGWAFTLFIAWNLLSMYIFVNMFTGVVVENFSYVFQTSGVRSISREEMRAFKKVWAEFANSDTGFLEKKNFVPFFAKLTGVFEVKIYPSDYSVPNILRASSEMNENDYAYQSKIVDGIDVNKLNRLVNSIDSATIRKRKAVYSRLYHEANMSHVRGKGISFTDMLMLLAHHKLIVDHEALVLKDLVARTAKTRMVKDLVNVDRVKCMLLTIHHRRKFLEYLGERRRQSMTYEQQQDIPAIVVDAMPSTPPQMSRDISGSWDSAPSTPTPSARFSIPDVSLGLETGPGLRRHHDKRRSSDIFSSVDLGNTSRDSTMSFDDPQNGISPMENSMWEDLMQEAEEEENKR